MIPCRITWLVMKGRSTSRSARWQPTSSQKAVSDPMGPPQGKSRVLRGGSFGDFAPAAESADRYDNVPDDRFVDFGFRVARTYSEPQPTRSKSAF